MTDRSGVSLDTGVFVFSWDFELAWGFHDLPTVPEKFDREDLRSDIHRLVDALEEAEIPSTWATVGHLFLDACTSTDGRVHPDLPRPRPDWYDCDPATDVDTDPAWYAPDVVERLVSADATQEIACHTFSHVTDDTSPDVLAAELEASRAAAPADVNLRSFVAPRHNAVSRKVLREAGFTNYRSTAVADSSVRRKLRFYTGRAPETGLPVRDEAGLWRLPTSTYFFYQPVHALQRRVPAIKHRWFRAGLERAARRNEVFHVWAHPHNFIGDDHAIAQFEALVERVAAMEENDKISAMTMSGLTASLED
mgnify:CR=1 FL=1